MKKKPLIILLIVFVVVVTLLILLLNKTTYYITVSKIDDKSPDRILTVYNDKDEKVEFKRIELLDGTFFCDNINPSVYVDNLRGIEELRVTLKDKSKVKARVIEEEVK